MQSPSMTPIAAIIEMSPPKAVSNRRTRYRRSIEERFGKTFRSLMEQLERHLDQLPRDKHTRIRSSSQCQAVVEMILADIGIPKIRDFLRHTDPDHFPMELTDDALRHEIRRFADDVITVASKSEEDAPLSLLDIYRRLPDGRLNIEQQMVRSILVQESRLDRSLRQEQKSKSLLPQTSKELTCYFGFLVEYAHWQFMQMPYGESQRECMDRVLELRRQN